MSMGVYHLLAVWQDNRAYYIVTIFERLVGGAIFYTWRPPWSQLIFLEWGVGGITLLCLLWEGRLLRETREDRKQVKQV